MLRRLSTSAAGGAEHYRRLAMMYRLAPVNGAKPLFESRVQCAHGKAVVKAPMQAEYNHAAHALHGCVYFKMLDDAAFFAAQSTNATNFVTTTSFTTYITKPVVPVEGQFYISHGKVTSASRSLIVAESVMSLPDGTEVARGSGTFMPHPKFTLDSLPAYTGEVLEEDQPLLTED